MRRPSRFSTRPRRWRAPLSTHPRSRRAHRSFAGGAQVRHELHKVRELLRGYADNEKFAVQRAIATFHKQENQHLSELQRLQSQRKTKEEELAALKEQLGQQQERARQQREEIEAELEAKLAPLREGDARPAVPRAQTCQGEAPLTLAP